MTPARAAPAAASPRRSTPSVLRRVGCGALAGAATLGLVFVAGELSGWRVLAGPAERWLSRNLGHAVHVGRDGPADFRLQLWQGIRLQAAGLRVASAAQEAAGASHAPPQPPLFEAEALSVRWRDLLAWRSGQPLPLHSLGADRLVARLVRDGQGHANWPLPQDAGPQDAASAASTAGSTADTAAGAAATPPAPGPGLQATATGSYRGLPVRGSLRTGSLQAWLADLSRPQDLGFTLALSVGRAQLAFDGALQDPLQRRDLLGRLARLRQHPRPTYRPAHASPGACCPTGASTCPRCGR